MAIKRFFISTSVVAALLAGRLIAQISLLGSRTVPTSEQLIASAGSEAVAADIVASVFADRLFLIRGAPSGSVTILSRQIPQSWLPKTTDLQFVRLDDERAREHLNACGTVTVVEFFTLATSDSVHIALAHVQKCRSSGLGFHLQRVGNEWRPYPGKMGSGWGGFISHCPCR